MEKEGDDEDLELDVQSEIDDIDDFEIEDDQDEILDLMKDYDLDRDAAQGVRDIMDSEGLDEDEAVELQELGYHESGGSVGSLIVLILLAWGGYSLWGWAFNDTEPVYTETYNSGFNFTQSGTEECLEPENPYSYGSGHYAGWEWGENGNYCDGNSNSFIEGCEEYQAAEEEYEACLQ